MTHSDTSFAPLRLCEKKSETIFSRNRVKQMLAFQPVDIPALECDINPVGFYEHGEKARELLKTCVGDFNPISESTFDAMSDDDGRAWLPRAEDFTEGEFDKEFPISK